jgi:hypothetical protein
MGIGVKKAFRYCVVFFLSIVILALLAPGLTAKAQQVTLGVYAGSSFTYGTPDGSPWVQMDPSNAPPLSRWEPFVNCSMMSFRVINDSFPSPRSARGYYFNETVKFKNETTPVSVIGYIDLYYGGGLGSTFFIRPGLKPGDYIYPGAAASGNYTWYINATRVDKLYWPGRSVCILNYSRNTPYKNSSSPLIAQQTTIYWDQTTGVLLGAFEEATGYNQGTQSFLGGVLLYELIANNVRIPLDYGSSLDLTPIYVSLAIGVVVVLGVIIVRAVASKPKGKYKRLKER